MKVSTKTRAFATFVVAGYFALGMVTRATDEIFPFFGWFLYATVPNQPTHYQAQIIEMAGTSLPKPLLFQDAASILPRTREVTAVKLMDSLGKAIESKSASIPELRAAFEANYLPGVTRYKIIKITYRPLEYWKSKTDTRTEIATLEVGAP